MSITTMLAFASEVVHFYGPWGKAITHFDWMPKLKIINLDEKEWAGINEWANERTNERVCVCVCGGCLKDVYVVRTKEKWITVCLPLMQKYCHDIMYLELWQ